VSSEKGLSERPLCPGDVVEVKSAAEILATLDSDAALDGMPFMPEMARHAGRRFTVARRVEKICNTVDTSGSRRMYDTVYLDDLRCDGSGHGGCQAGCRIYWKEAWLRRVEDGPPAVKTVDGGEADLERAALAGTHPARASGDDGPELWRCQATEALNASEHLKVSSLSQYWREVKSRNFRPLRFVALLARAFVMEVANRVGVLKSLPLQGPGDRPSPTPLNLRPGDRVRVRPPADIAATLDESGHNRGLSFDREMLPYCGKTLRVKDKVDHIIDETTGRMLKIPKDSVVLEGSVCSGVRSPGRWFCPREIYPFWREAWLERIEDQNGGAPVEAREGEPRSTPEEPMPRVGEM
jgi:hypothetical protein